MKHYTLTAEQMQQVREKIYRLACLGNGDRFGTSIGNGIAQDALATLDAAMQAPEATEPKDYADLKALRRLACRTWRHDLTRQQALDALKNLQNAAQDSYGTRMTDALELPEATAGGDVREAAEAMVCVVDGYINETATIHQLKAANASVAAALAAAPKPCEPAHGTKPEAPTELCKVCGQIQAHWHHADNVPAANCHPFTPTDATPKDEEPGR